MAATARYAERRRSAREETEIEPEIGTEAETGGSETETETETKTKTDGDRIYGQRRGEREKEIALKAETKVETVMGVCTLAKCASLDLSLPISQLIFSKR